MFNKLEETKKRYEFLTDEIVKPEVIANQNEWKKLVKERADIEEIVNKYAEYKETKSTKGKVARAMIPYDHNGTHFETNFVCTTSRS